MGGTLNMTKKEFKDLMEVSFDDAMDYLCRHNDNIIDKDTLMNMVISSVKNDLTYLAIQQMQEIKQNVNYYRIDSIGNVKPVTEYEHIEDLLEDDREEPELTIEQIRNYIEENYVDINTLFDSDTIIDWVKDNCDIEDLIEIDTRWQ